MTKAASHINPGSMIFFSFLTCQLCLIPAEANPNASTASVGQGSVTFNPSGSVLTINQTTPYAYINWASFNINAGETTTFVQPSSSSVAWNHITDANPSQILGNLNANGYVVLQNQNGFVIGGSAAITAHGLVLTTASTASLNIANDGAWTFDTPPPTAKIVNYGQINITGGGSVFLIASDIVNQNNATISAPGGTIGLYDGEQVLVSMSPDGRGLSSQVTLPKGSVDNEGNLIADGGTIAAQVQMVNQNGLVQANAAQNVNGTIELVASDSVSLGASSTISSQGAGTGTSPGGTVAINAGNTMSDQAGSTINVSGGAQGGNGGVIEITAPLINGLQSSLTGQAAAGYANGSFSLDTGNILLNSTGAPVSGEATLNANSLTTEFSQINLTAAKNIELNSQLDFAAQSGVLDVVSMIAGNTVTIDAGSGIEANGGSITLKGSTINQNGTVKADSVGAANGIVEMDATSTLNLGATSVISAQGDATSSSASPGGFVILNAGENTFMDATGSSISVAGNAKGQGGIVEIFGNGTPAVNSSISGCFSELVNPFDLTLSSSAADSPTFTLGALSKYSQIDLMALDEIILGQNSSAWTLGGSLSLTAGNNITLYQSVTTGTLATGATPNNRNINLTAGTHPDIIGTTLPDGSAPDPGSIDLVGGATLQAQAGKINLWAANNVIVQDGAVRTIGGGSISVTAEQGDVNTGDKVNGYLFGQKAKPYYKVDTANLGGISTAAGGNVTINAGGNVISFLPTQSDWTDAQYDGGTGAFGPLPGNVSITAGGSVYGHYVVTDGIGTITAKTGNVGVPLTDQDQSHGFALSLIKGSWNVYTPGGSIYVQDINNPNGVFGEKPGASSANYAGYHAFDYDPSASVLLDAGKSIEFTGNDAPQAAPTVLSGGDSIPFILPPSFTAITGAGDLTLDVSLSLYPSSYQYLNLAIGGNFIGVPNGNPISLNMSDSSATSWLDSSTFGPNDHGPTPLEVNNPNSAEISVAGNMEDVNLYTTMQTQITVGGNVVNSGFWGENLHASDVSTIHVAGNIENSPLYSFDALPGPLISANPNETGDWQSVFELAVNQDPAMIAALTSFDANNLTTGNLITYLKNNNYLLFPSSVGSSATYGLNPGFVYDPGSGQLGFKGNLSTSLTAQQLQALESGSIVVLVADAKGNPIIDPTTGHLQVRTYTFGWGSVIGPSNPGISPTTGDLVFDTQNNSTVPGIGYQIGGPGLFDISANNINLGNSPGIVSEGFAGDLGSYGPDFGSLESLCPTLDSSGAAIDVNVNGNLDMVTSRISSIDGGNVTVKVGGGINLSEGTFVFPVVDCYGIWTSGQSSVSVTAGGDINVGSSRIATFNGGDVYVESLNGNVDCGTGANIALEVFTIDGTIGQLNGNLALDPAPYGSGILAEYPPLASQIPGSSGQPGSITVVTHKGNIISGQGGISQIALNGSIASGPSVNLTAGITGVAPTPDQGNILLGGAVVGGTINVDATGKVQGFYVSQQNLNITGLSFTGSGVAGQTANLSTSEAGGPTVVVGIGGINASGLGGNATLLSQNVSGSGGSSTSTLGTSVSASSASQAAAQQSSQAGEQQGSDNSTGEENQNKKKKKPAIQKINRVTVLLSSATPLH